VSAIGRRPFTPPADIGSTEPCHGWMDIVRAHRTEWGLGPPDTRISCVLQTGGSRCINKAVAFVFASHARQPAVVVKIARTPEAAAGLAREAETLAALHAIGRVLPGGIPRLLFRTQQSDVLAIGETALGGTSITGRLARARYRALAAVGTDWLAALARVTQASPVSWRELSGAALAELETTFGEAIDPALPIRIGHAFTDLEDLPSVCEHRDFSPWNILVRDDGALSVLDWESSEQRGLPALDLIYFLSYLAFYRDGPLGWPGRQPGLAEYRRSYRRAWDPAQPTSRVNHECLSWYATGVGFDASASVLHALRLFTWLLHARSEYQRLAADCGRTPPPDILRGALFVNLLDEEARIHGH
jgi:hypothetical protein